MKKSKKGLDKNKKVCYNKATIRVATYRKKGIDTMTKMTYALALDYAIANLDNDEVVDKLVALKASIDKRNSADRKPTKAQKENEAIKAEILSLLADGTPRTVSDIMTALPMISSNQKASALVRQLVLDNLVKREEVKRKAYFSIV